MKNSTTDMFIVSCRDLRIPYTSDFYEPVKERFDKKFYDYNLQPSVYMGVVRVQPQDRNEIALAELDFESRAKGMGYWSDLPLVYNGTKVSWKQPLVETTTGPIEYVIRIAELFRRFKSHVRNASKENPIVVMTGVADQNQHTLKSCLFEFYGFSIKDINEDLRSKGVEQDKLRSLDYEFINL